MSPRTPPVQPPMPPGRKWQWEDGKMHDSPPPSMEPITVSLPESYSVGALAAIENGVPQCSKPEPPFPPIPGGWLFSDRARLRSAALDFVIRAAALRRDPVSAAQMITEAEYLERWIAKP